MFGKDKIQLNDEILQRWYLREWGGKTDVV